MATSTPTATDSRQPDGMGVSSQSKIAADTPFTNPALPPRPLHAMTRVFPGRDLFRGHARWSLIWSICGAILMLSTIVSLWMLVHLLQTGGQLQLSAEAAKECSEFTGIEIVASETTDLGLRPVVWQMRDRFWGEHLAAIYAGTPALQSNIGAFLALLIVALLTGLMARWLFGWARLSAARMGLEITSRLRKSLHRQALRVGPGDLLESDRERVNDLFLNDVSRLQFAIADRIYQIGTGIVLAFTATGVALLIDWRITLQCLIPLGCCWYLYLRLRHRQVAARSDHQSQLGNELDRLASGFAKTRIIRGYGMENFEHRQFESELNEFDRRVARSAAGSQNLHMLAWIVAAVATSIVLFFVAVKVLHANGTTTITLADGLTLGTMMAFLFLPAMNLSQLRQDWARVTPAAERLYRYLDRIPEVSQAVGAKFLQPLASSLQYESISVEIPGQGRVLKNVDLKVPAGKVAAFVSHDPLSARALAYLLPRFIEPSSGRVLVDGEDIAWVTLESLRAETAYIGGTDPWFSGTVLENIRGGDEHRTLQDVTEAAKTVHAHKFIAKLPYGYETVLGESAHRLNPGEAFRLALARAVLKDPAVLIIEEPSDPLDADTKSLIDDAYNRILKDRTVIFLPTRLSTVKRCDFVVLLHNRKVDSIGSHAALVKTSPAYRHWEYLKFNEFRPATESV